MFTCLPLSYALKELSLATSTSRLLISENNSSLDKVAFSRAVGVSTWFVDSGGSSTQSSFSESVPVSSETAF